MTCDLSRYRAGVGMFYTRALRLSLLKLGFVTIENIVPFLLLFVRGTNSLPIALLYFVLLDYLVLCTAFSHGPTCKVYHTTTIQKFLLSGRVLFEHVVMTSLLITTCLLVLAVTFLLLMLAGDVHPNPGPAPGTSEGLSVAHINVRSIRNKLYSLECELGSFDVISVSETWLSDDIHSDSLLLQGFHPPVRQDRAGAAYGGVAVYVKSNLIVKPRPDLSVPLLEAVWIETKLGQDTLLIGTFYRPCDANVHYWDLINQSIQLAGNTPHKVLILGDFNADCSVQPPPHLQNILVTNNLVQLVDKPTRVTEETSTIIDLILTPSPHLICKSDVLAPVCSDHSVPYIILNNHPKPNVRYRRTIYNYSKLDKPKLESELSNIDWNYHLNQESIDDSAEAFSNIVMSVARVCMPVKEVIIQERDAPWITPEIKHLIKKKNTIHQLAKFFNSAWVWALFRKIRNDLTSAIRRRKAEYMTELDNRISCPDQFGSKEWWRLVKSFISKKGMPVDDIPPIVDAGKVHYSHADKATAFNQFFAKQCSIDNDSGTVPPLNQFEESIPPLLITKDMLMPILKGLDNSKAVGPDLVHNKILTSSANVICEPLVLLFNRSLTEGKFPVTWKCAHVTPIFKKGEKHKCDNYRPISLLSCVGKLLERCVYNHVLEFLQAHSLLTAAQSGFLPKDSTVFQLLSIYDDLCKSLDTRTTTQIIFFDISKAFDKVWHQGLIHKLSATGIRGQLLNWFCDYLHNRVQAVVLKGHTSTYLPLSAGVPQGSVLGPLLFLVYINDIVNDIESIIKLFADDTSMYLSLENCHVRTLTLNSDLKKISTWAKLWKVKFNQSKTELMTICNRVMPQTMPLEFEDVILEDTDSHKHLGVTLQNNCKWDLHVQSIISKCRVLISCLRSFKYRLSRKSLEIMYKSFIMPHFDFSDVVWDNCNCTLLDDLEKLHLDALRTIVGTVRGTSHVKLYTESGFTSLKERRFRHKILLYFKLVNSLAPPYLVNRVPPLTSQVNPYHRRNPLERYTPACRTELYKSSYFPSTTALWNNLPEDIRQTTSLSLLKRYLCQLDSTVPKYYYLPDRTSEILLCRLRLEMSDLNYDLFNRHISNNPTCECGFVREDASHFLMDCPLYQHARAQTIDLLSNDVKSNLQTLLFGRADKSVFDNVDILSTVGKFITLTNRFSYD